MREPVRVIIGTEKDFDDDQVVISTGPLTSVQQRLVNHERAMGSMAKKPKDLVKIEALYDYHLL